MNDVPADLTPILADLLFAVADDKLMLGHRNSDWTGLGPILEEDIAFSSLAQDEIAHAQALYELAGTLLDRGADQLAFGRPVEAYRCAQLVTLSDEFDWSVAIVRQFFCDHFDRLRLERLSRSAWLPLRDLASRMAAEEQVHVDHVDGWIRRLADGTDESRARLADALVSLAPHAAMLAEPVENESRLVQAGLYPQLDDGDLFDVWRAALDAALAGTDLTLSMEPPAPPAVGGRRGAHAPLLAELLDEMCEVFRLEPDAAW